MKNESDLEKLYHYMIAVVLNKVKNLPEDSEIKNYLESEIIPELKSYDPNNPKPQSIGCHATHCCSVHGCKYGKENECPVENGSIKAEFFCEYCYEDLQNLINDYGVISKKIRKYFKYSDKLSKIVEYLDRQNNIKKF